MSVTRIEGLVFLPVIADEQAAISEYTVYIEDQQAYL